MNKIIKQIFKNIIIIFNKNTNYVINIKKKTNINKKIIINGIKFYRQNIKNLNDFNFKITNNNCLDLYNFYNEIIPIFCKKSQNVFIRNKLVDLSKKHKDLNEKISTLIANYNLNDGVVDRATLLKKKIFSKINKYQKAYGAQLFDKNLNNIWKNADRGITLVDYFSNNSKLIFNKKILRIAPEENLKKFFLENIKKYRIINYHINDFTNEANFSFNIENILLKKNTYDLIICHRVLEHVHDDFKAIKSMLRILKVNGILNVSFPQNPSQKTINWYIPDISHNEHVRHYGWDFENMLKKKNIKVSLDKFFLKKNKNYFDKKKIYPMRIYNISKSI
jgi:SAM-dependent methyltransferase